MSPIVQGQNVTVTNTSFSLSFLVANVSWSGLVIGNAELFGIRANLSVSWSSAKGFEGTLPVCFVY